MIKIKNWRFYTKDKSISAQSISGMPKRFNADRIRCTLINQRTLPSLSTITATHFIANVHSNILIRVIYKSWIVMNMPGIMKPHVVPLYFLTSSSLNSCQLCWQIRQKISMDNFVFNRAFNRMLVPTSGSQVHFSSTSGDHALNQGAHALTWAVLSVESFLLSRWRPSRYGKIWSTIKSFLWLLITLVPVL